jgi:hypothetical protein
VVVEFDKDRSCLDGCVKYCLLVGNTSVDENSRAAVSSRATYGRQVVSVCKIVRHVKSG